MRRRIFLAIALIFLSLTLGAAEYRDGSLRLVLDADSGRFSIYLLTETNLKKPQALFSDQDPRTSFLSVFLNDRSYKMGETSTFKTRLGGDNNNPSLIFESPFLAVNMGFSFARTPNSALTNALRITITLENRADREINVGARFLLDTNLGEGSNGFPITTNQRTIATETLIASGDNDRFWTDRNANISLTGSIKTGSAGDPDSVHIANWKKLSDVTWKASYQPGRNFNFPPYSVGDTAVCYYFDPRPLGRLEKRSFGFSLALNSENLTDSASAAASEFSDLPMPPTADSREQDLAALRELLSRIDEGIASGAASEEELAAMEFTLNKLRAKYGPPGN